MTLQNLDKARELINDVEIELTAKKQNVRLSIAVLDLFQFVEEITNRFILENNDNEL